MVSAMQKTALLAVLALISPLVGAESKNVKIGDTIGGFNANTDQGGLWRLSDHLAKDGFLVVYFYPAAMTGGCTAQACAYRDAAPDLKAKNIKVVGVSGDAVNGLKVFKQAHNLNFALLSDVNGIIAKRFGVPQREGGSIQRTVDGKDFTLDRAQTSARWTFVLDGKGKLIFKDSKVNPKQDAAKVMAFIRARQKD
jgi:thioredoxin-dependent peroxiredoxin